MLDLLLLLTTTFRRRLVFTQTRQTRLSQKCERRLRIAKPANHSQFSFHLTINAFLPGQQRGGAHEGSNHSLGTSAAHETLSWLQTLTNYDRVPATRDFERSQVASGKGDDDGAEGAMQAPADADAERASLGVPADGKCRGGIPKDCTVRSARY